MTGLAGAKQNGARTNRRADSRVSTRHVYSPHASRARASVSPKGCDMHHTPVQHRYMRPSPSAATLVVAACLVATTLSFGHAHSTATYGNPVLPGDYPDPSVIRVGDTFWATATTSQWAPLFPLMKSADLVNWTRAGAVFQDPPRGRPAATGHRKSRRIVADFSSTTPRAGRTDRCASPWPPRGSRRGRIRITAR